MRNSGDKPKKRRPGTADALVKERTRSGGAYALVKERARARMASISRAGRDIGDLPKIAHPRRRKAALASLQKFLETYLGATFYLPWSPDHLEAIKSAEKAVLFGELMAWAMARAFGKSSICEGAALWAVCRGSRRFIAMIGATVAHAEETLDSLKMEFETNEKLAEDFPELCYPIRQLEGIVQKGKGQLCCGHRTRIQWGKDHIALAFIAPEVLRRAGIPEKNGTGAVIWVAGITGRIRGKKYKTPDGQTIRPDLVIVDDPQTDESSISLTENKKRIRVLSGAILGLAGPDKKIAGFMPCTVITKGDMADQILDPKKHPRWQGRRMKMVYAFPTNEKLWDEYAEMRREAQRNLEPEARAATEFYKANREAMDLGAQVAWPAQFNTDEVSALQHAMNLRIDDEAAFFAEYQNEPISEDAEDTRIVSVEDVMAKINSRQRGQVPVECDLLTASIDVSPRVIYWCVVAWGRDFSGAIVDYGTEPDQKRAHFSLRNAQHTLSRAHPGRGADGAIYAGLEAATQAICGREWKREDGTVMRISRVLIDAGHKPDTVHLFCRQTPFAATVMPSLGRGVTAGQKPIAMYERKPGVKIGTYWWFPPPKARVLRYVDIDTNYWKTFIHERFATKMGDKGCLSLWGKSQEAHRLFAEHIAASERRIPTEGYGRKLDEWKQIGSNDNHWLDCLVYAAVAASMNGVGLSLSATAPKPKAASRYRSGRELQRLAREKRAKATRPAPRSW